MDNPSIDNLEITESMKLSNIFANAYNLTKNPPIKAIASVVAEAVGV